MKNISIRPFFTFFVCFLTIIMSTVLPAADGNRLKNGKAIEGVRGHSLSKLLKRSNSVERTPEILDQILREKALARLADELLSKEGDAAFSPEDSTFLAAEQEGPWFQGWYTRITDKKGGLSIAVVGATQYLPSPEPGESSSTEGYLPGYIGVIIANSEMTKVYEAFPENTGFISYRDTVLDDPDSPDWEEFSWTAEDPDGLKCEITNKKIKLYIPEYVDVTASLGPRLPYNNIIQWLGPEGLVEFLPFIPLHWFVYTLGSDAKYSYTMLDKENQRTVKGKGYAHQESNWGTVFPPAWVWAEGIGDNSTQFALSGGVLELGESSLTTWLAAYHSSRVKWQFRPTLPGTEFITEIDSCKGSFSMIAKDQLRKLQIKATSLPENFVELSVPTDRGFSPNAEESFATTVEIKAYVKLPFFGYLKVDQYTFNDAALEFGAGYRCPQ